MLLAYLDEFGHIGPFVSARHEKHNTHPAFGYAGFVIPARHVRAFGGYFEHRKEQLLKVEIQRSNAQPRRWEKKGASLLTTRNMASYGAEIAPVFRRLSRRLAALDGRLVFFGRAKPIGTAEETRETATDRSTFALTRAILELSRYAEARNEHILIFIDAVGSKPRLEAVMATASFIYRAHLPELRRVVEVPMQLESHYYGTTQYADWLCALISRASHFHLVADSEFGWAPTLLGECFADECRRLTSSCISTAKDDAPLTIGELAGSNSWCVAQRLEAAIRLAALGGSDPRAVGAPRRVIADR